MDALGTVVLPYVTVTAHPEEPRFQYQLVDHDPSVGCTVTSNLLLTVNKRILVRRFFLGLRSFSTGCKFIGWHTKELLLVLC